MFYCIDNVSVEETVILEFRSVSVFFKYFFKNYLFKNKDYIFDYMHKIFLKMTLEIMTRGYLWVVAVG